MIQLTPAYVRLGARAPTKEEAIRAAGRVLVDNGNIAPGYVESMLGREEQANTYLAHGIAIPHGMATDRDLIHRTGVAVVQLPEGVEWNADQAVHLVIGIAARSDEHLEVLAALTDLLDDPSTAARLAATRNAADIIAALARAPGAGAEDAAPMPGSTSIDVTIQGAGGLHARPAVAFVDVARRFGADIRVHFNGRSASGKAMASLLKLGIEGGATIRLEAGGPDAAAALEALKSAVERGLGETDEVPHPTGDAGLEARAWVPLSSGRAIGGVAASPGLAIGPLHHFQPTHMVVRDAPGAPDAEHRTLLEALDTARGQLRDVYESVQARVGKPEAAIFHAHQALLDDEELIAEVERLIARGHGAAWSWQHVVTGRVAEQRQLRNERLAGRAADLHDVGQRVLRVLAGTTHGEPLLPDQPVILVADDLAPSDTARLDPERILGLCTAGGGPTSHTAIIARSLDIPAVVGAGAAVLELASGVTCILDGTAGVLYTEPSAAELASGRAFQEDRRRQREEEQYSRYQPAIMTDGHRVEVAANIGRAAEAALAVEAGAEGIGLLRTEFLFLERDTPPTEDEQFEAYRTMTRALNGLPLVIRTLDIGGDKAVPYLVLAREENPFLGVRGIRLCLQRPELFLPQLRAIYRASMTGPVKIMFPMIATLEDLRAARGIADQVRDELGAPPVEIGIMVEVPSAVALAPEFARECDFFSIGTNDLTQYVLAMDRLHPALARQVDGLHPAVLREVDRTVRAATAEGRPVGVCGGIAGDPRGALILAGLGVAELSMSIPSIAAVKAYLRGVSHADAAAIARQALACTTADQVRRLPLPA